LQKCKGGLGECVFYSFCKNDSDLHVISLDDETECVNYDEKCCLIEDIQPYDSDLKIL
jgi:hypothetical protein